MNNENAELIMGAFLLLVMFGMPSAFFLFIHYEDRKSKKRLGAAEARAYPMQGKVARFGTTAADEDSVRYTFQLEGDATVYRVDSTYLSKASNGELTSPGDMVTFRVLPGLRSVRDFYNSATARA